MAAMTLSGMAWCQPGSVIRLTNPSFEDYAPGPGNVPINWANCGPERESPPDTQPCCFGVTRKAFDGNTYLGMVVRDDGTNESVGQQLSDTLHTGRCYLMSAMLSRSNVFRSFTRSLIDSADFTVPAVLRVYGGTSLCGKLELLAETAPVNHFKWMEYEFILKPLGNYTHIVLAAEFEDINKRLYNGHILLDRLSDIEEVVCDD